jgi:hypothetical protein
MQRPPGWGRENRETIFTVHIHIYFEGQRALYMIDYRVFLLSRLHLSCVGSVACISMYWC